MRAPVLVAAAAAAVISSQSAAPSHDYTQWRGPERDGSAAGFVPPAAWPAALTRAWRADVGEGYSGPLVAGTTVYAFTRRDGNEVLTALDAANGATRWRTSYAAPYIVNDAAAR